MKYIKFFLLLIVVCASLAGAPRVFAATQIFPSIVAGVVTDWNQTTCTGLGDWVIRLYAGSYPDNVGSSITGSSSSGQPSYDNFLPHDYSGSLTSGSSYWVGITCGSFSTTPTYYFNFDYDDTFLTRIVSFTPLNGAVTATSTSFSISFYINPSDVGTFSGFEYNFCYQKQPIGALETCLLDSVHATTTGLSTFNFTRDLVSGNYVLNAQLQRSYLGGVFINPFSGGVSSNSLLTQFHQFVVNQGTFLGNIFQDGIDDIQGYVDSATATSSLVSLERCNPLGDFSIIDCTVGLIFPSTEQTTQVFSSLHDLVLTKFPIGYVTRFSAILLNTSTSTLPQIEYEFASTSPFAGIDLYFDPFGALEESTNILHSAVSDRDDSQNVWEIMEEIVNIIIYLMLGFMIFHDLTNIHKHHTKDKFK